MFFNEMKTVRMKSSFTKWCFITSGKRKSESESESESIEVTSGMSTDEGEEKRKKKGKKLVKHRDRKRERKGKGMHGEMLPLYTIYNFTSLNLKRHKEAMI